MQIHECKAPCAASKRANQAIYIIGVQNNIPSPKGEVYPPMAAPKATKVQGSGLERLSE